MYYFFKDIKLSIEEENQILNESLTVLKDQFFLVTLTATDWDDYGFKTDFTVWINNLKTGIKCGLGTLKIGYKNQQEGWTIEDSRIKNKILNSLDDDFFSMFSSEDSYNTIWEYFTDEYETLSNRNLIEPINNETFIRSNVNSLFNGLNEIAYKETLKDDENIVKDQDVFKHSFLRSTSYTSILYDYSDSAKKNEGITNFFVKISNIEFKSILNSRPSTNIHAIIGSNGNGKSYILDKIIEDYLVNSEKNKKIRKLILVSFSPFDKLSSYKKFLTNDNFDRKINYIGLKEFYINASSPERLIIEQVKNNEHLENEFYTNFSLALKKDRELLHKIFSEISKSHPISLFKEVDLDSILNLDKNEDYINFILEYESKKTNEDNNKDIIYKNKDELESDYINSKIGSEEFKIETIEKFRKLSSGYQMIIYTLSSLIAHLEKGNLVLYDEPEVYLHPPLLLTYIKLLRSIFIEKNGMGIFATHSPILLQELPKNCVKIIKGIKNNKRIVYSSCPVETYGSSITTINNEIFKLENINTGYYNDILENCKNIEGEFKNTIDNEEKIDKVIALYNDSIGDEGLAIIYNFFYTDEE
ncbi:AAA family ATPase [Acinetobacter sp. 1000160]|uniref:AAA family ATPase n=1 Tax=Acinetobacter sp. 1000160 TaxID=1310800 RepID=UPI0004517DBE|nr:AAA family ATPase [Acinetobacter sp. 1000160]EXB47946.1 AAA domain protein [Acinetobacter baumannii 146457]EYT20079.1 AAA domain protein [Acinetobacter sp. 1000160]